MKKSSKGQRASKRGRESSEVKMLGEFPPVIIKSGGGLLRGGRVEPTDVLQIISNVGFTSKLPTKDKAWKEAYTSRWNFHKFHIYVGEDRLTFPLSSDNVVLLMLNQGWIKFISRPHEDSSDTALWIEASDYILQQQEPAEGQWTVSQTIYPAIITGVQVFPSDAIFTYAAPGGNVSVEFHEPPLMPK